jgi:hypothetical protein
VFALQTNSSFHIVQKSQKVSYSLRSERELTKRRSWKDELRHRMGSLDDGACSGCLMEQWHLQAVGYHLDMFSLNCIKKKRRKYIPRTLLVLFPLVVIEP